MAGITHISIIVLIVMISTISFASGNEPVMACYMHDIGSERLKDFDPTLCTHIVYYGMNITFDEVVMPETMEQKYMNITEMFKRWKENNPSLKIIISANIDMNMAKRQDLHSLIDNVEMHSPFMNSLIRLMDKYDLDGFNLGYNDLSQTDSTKLKQFFDILREKMESSNKILTATITVCANILTQDNIKYLNMYFRFIFVMCGDYDLEYMVARQNELSTDIDINDMDIIDMNINDIQFTTAENMMKEFIANKWNQSTLVLGIELQAHTYKTNKALRQMEIAIEFYGRVCPMWKNRNDIWQESSNPKRSCMVRTFNDATNMTEIFYNSPLNMESKIEFVKNHEIAGVMMWPINGDDVFDICEDEYPIFHDSVNFPILRSARKYIDEILTKTWEHGDGLKIDLSFAAIAAGAASMFMAVISFLM